MKDLAIMTLAALSTPLGAAIAQTEDWNGRYDHMMWGGGFGMLGGLMMIVFWGAIIALIILAVRWFSVGRTGERQRNALDILRERYAAGEIDEEEYDRRKEFLEKK